jgi:aldehyde:ferredoxin oxidoreductase
MTRALGYAGRILKVDLSSLEISCLPLPDASVLRRFVGGTGLGVYYLYHNVPPRGQWDEPENIVAVFAGIFANAPVPGGATISFVTKGAMTGLAGSSQANGFLGTFLKSNGFDGIILRGSAKEWQLLMIRDGEASLLPAREFLGLDTFSTDRSVREAYALRVASIYAIGPAGENRVRYAAVVGDKGHVAAHNGIGAVLGSKRLKCIAVERGPRAVEFFDRDRLIDSGRQMLEYARTFDTGARATWGTASHVEALHQTGQLPVKNYTTTKWEPYKNFTGQRLRTLFKHKPKPCWACSLHCKYTEVTEGPYRGLVAEEPEYEALAAFGPLVDNQDLGAAVMLTDLTDRMGLDINETGWVLSWLMECSEANILPESFKARLIWGDIDGMATLIKDISFREGPGEILAEGVKRASEQFSPECASRGVYTMKGSSPRGHDHRGRWDELLDTCLGNTGTIEATGGKIDVTQHGLAPVVDRFSPVDVATMNARMNGRRILEDCVGICRFVSEHFGGLVEAIRAATGWEMTEEEALNVGRRTVNYLRAFNLCHGLRVETEWPSTRYGSAPTDGPVAGVSILPSLGVMRETYWREMGWSEGEGRPLPETLRKLCIEELTGDLWTPRKTCDA